MAASAPRRQTAQPVLAWPAFRKERSNPHAALLARELQRFGVEVEDWTPLRALLRPGAIWHLHHPETVLYRRSAVAASVETAAFLLLLKLARMRGTKVVWTAHDVGSNDARHPRLEALFWRRFVPAVDHLILLSEHGREAAHAAFPDLRRVPWRIAPHGHYADAYPNEIGRDEAQRRLGIAADTPVALQFGLIRPYKEVPCLIRAFGEARIPDGRLVIAGAASDAAVERDVRQAAERVEGVQLELGYVRPEEVQVFFGAADLVVLPYRKITNSGTAFLALTFGRPVLVPTLGAMPELARMFGDEWVMLYEPPLTPLTLARALARARATERPTLDIAAAGWGEAAAATREVYRSLTVQGAGARDTVQPAATAL